MRHNDLFSKGSLAKTAALKVTTITEHTEIHGTQIKYITKNKKIKTVRLRIHGKTSAVWSCSNFSHTHLKCDPLQHTQRLEMITLIFKSM